MKSLDWEKKLLSPHPNKFLLPFNLSQLFFSLFAQYFWISFLSSFPSSFNFPPPFSSSLTRNSSDCSLAIQSISFLSFYNFFTVCLSVFLSPLIFSCHFHGKFLSVLLPLHLAMINILPATCLNERQRDSDGCGKNGDKCGDAETRACTNIGQREMFKMWNEEQQMTQAFDTLNLDENEVERDHQIQSTKVRKGD